ncbi:MAG: Crp/Fnr family transcriptional regulator [Magnetospirillum sp.]|nr:Crp/Fnr family transcriptional regulator [Magnetospirillum sp.]
MIASLTDAFTDLAALDADALRVLDASARPVVIPAGTVVFTEGGACSVYMLVTDGSVRVQKVSDGGREIVLYRVERGQSCVLTTNCLLAGENYSAEGVAETEVRALTIPAATFRVLLARSEVFRDFVFATYAARISDLLMLIEEVAFGRIDVRLAGWLAQRQTPEGIRTTHQEIATELGTAREVVSRQLKEFERRGWVALYRGRVEVRDASALARLTVT